MKAQICTSAYCQLWKRQNLYAPSHCKPNPAKICSQKESPQYIEHVIHHVVHRQSPDLLDKGATNLLRRQRLAFRGVTGISFTLGCVAPTDCGRLRRFCSRSTWTINISMRLPVTGSESSERAVPWLVRLCKTQVVGMTFWPTTGLTLDNGAVGGRHLSANHIRHYCRCFLQPLYRSVSVSIKKHGVEKHFSMTAIMVLFTNGGVQRKTEKKGLLVVSHFRKNACSLRKRLFQLFYKDGACNGWWLIGFWTA